MQISQYTVANAQVHQTVSGVEFKKKKSVTFNSKLQVRFKLASSYSGRVLKHVYEDGQELDSPEEKYPHSFVHRKIPPSHLEVEQLCGFEDTQGDQQGGFLLLCTTVSLYCTEVCLCGCCVSW